MKESSERKISPWLRERLDTTLPGDEVEVVIELSAPDLLLDHHPPSHPPRQLRLGPRPDRRRAFIDGWNERCHPFAWTKTADQILPHASGQRGSS